jgi:hypothetical protein
MDTRRDPIALASTGVAFSQAAEHNVRSMTQEIEEYKARIRDFEEEVRHYKVDRTNITEFRACDMNC